MTRCPSCGARAVVDPDFPHPESPGAPKVLHHRPTCSADQRDHFILACGCQGWTRGPAVDGEFVYSHCGDDTCEYFRYVLAEGARQHKPVEIRLKD